LGAEVTVPQQAILTLTGVGRDFGGVRALHNLDLSVRQGSVTAVIGPNGAGKSTLFNVITGAVPASRGTVRFRDTDVSGWPAHRIISLGVGRTFQNIRLFNTLNVLENVMAGFICRTHASLLETLLWLPRDRHERKLIVDRAESLLADLQIYEHRFYLPGELPYGAQRRAEIARALATSPELLLLDEPAAGMTAAESQDLIRVIQRLSSEGMTILLVEHNMQLVMGIAETICVLNFGEKIAEGPPKAIQTHHDVLEAYLGRGS
jgi:branched-chain amino acid transport system ATP-binding protein